MELVTLITILGMLVAIVGGVNTILELMERLHTYTKALKERANPSLGTSYANERPAPQKTETRFFNAPPKANIPESYTPYRWMAPLKEIAGELNSKPLANTVPFLKKSSVSYA